MKGFSALQLPAECGPAPSDTGFIQPKSLVPSCEPFRTLSAHVGLHVTIDGIHTGSPNEYSDYPCGCGSYRYANGALLTEKFPGIGDFPGRNAGVYGHSDHNRTLDLTNFYFLDSEISKISRRNLMGVLTSTTSSTTTPAFTSTGTPTSSTTRAPNWMERFTCSGPAIRNLHACYKLTHRHWGDDYLLKYIDWYFQDPSGEDSACNVTYPDNDHCCYKDWLAFSYPARWIWYNSDLLEPFFIADYYEDGCYNQRLAIDYAMGEAGYGYLPFCEPLQVFSDETYNTKIGEYVGYIHSIFFNNNAYVCGNDKSSAKMASSTPTVKRYDLTKIPMGMEVNTYLLAKPAEGYEEVLKSPRLTTTRVWYPLKDIVQDKKGDWVPNRADPCSPYFYFAYQAESKVLCQRGLTIKYRTATSSSVSVYHGLRGFTVQLVA